MITQNSGNLSDDINNGEDKRPDVIPATTQETEEDIKSEIQAPICESESEIDDSDKENVTEEDAVAHETERIICKNCETDFTGHFCNNCGQSAKDFDRPVSVLIVDAMANIMAFDTRLWKSLKSILFKPGEMALDYIAGKRVRYMPPFRLYLFISFVFFLLLRFSINSNSNINLFSSQDKEEGVKTEQSIASGSELTVSAALAKNKVQKTEVQQDETQKSAVKKDAVKENGNINIKKIDDIKANQELYISKFLSYLSWALILMMPLYAMLLWFLFRKYQRHYLGHFIFSLNQHAFLFVIFSIQIIISLIFPEKETIYEAWLLLAFPLYLIAGARKLYKAKWSSIIFKMGAAFIIYQIIVISSIVLLLYIIFANTM